MSQSIPNHVRDPKTDFIESAGFLQAFDVDKKLAFLSLFKQNGLKFWRTCAELGVKGDTVHKHYNNDPAFRKAVDQAKTEYYDELEGVSRTNALNPRSVIERIFQLKARFPDKYGDNKRSSDLQITLNIDGKMLDMVKKRDEVIEGQLVNDSARESVQLSASKVSDNSNSPKEIE